MESKSHALAAGAFVVAAAALLIALAMWLTRDVANTSAYELVTDGAVTGLQPQAAVRFKGVDVGKVTDIGFDPDQRGNVLVRIAVTADAPVTGATFATLAFQGVTGLSFVQLDDLGGASAPLPPGPHGGPPRIPLRSSALIQLTERAGNLMDRLEKTADNLNQILGAQNQAALAAALKNIGGAAKTLDQLAAHTDQTLQAQLGPGRADLPALARQAAATLKSLESASAKAGAALDTINTVAAQVQRGVGRVTGEGGLIDRLSDSAASVNATTLPRIQALSSDASRTMHRLDRVMDTLGDNPQSLLYGSGPIPPGPGEPGFIGK